MSLFTESPQFASALTQTAAILTTKLLLVHVVTARERILSSQFVQKFDAHSPALPFFRALLLAHPSMGFGGQDFIDRCERIEKNCAENEPFFLAVATIAGMSSAVDPAMATTLLWTYLGARISHTVVYLSGNSFLAVLRPVTFLVGALTTLAMAKLSLTSKGMTNEL